MTYDLAQENARLRFAVVAMRALLRDLRLDYSLASLARNPTRGITRGIAIANEALRTNQEGANMNRTDLDGRDSWPPNARPGSLAGLDAYLTREEPPNTEKSPVESDELELVYNDLRELTARHETALAKIAQLRTALLSLRDDDLSIAGKWWIINNALKDDGP